MAASCAHDEPHAPQLTAISGVGQFYLGVSLVNYTSALIRTRTVISQAHRFQWLGSFGNRGNGRYREELRKGLAALARYLAAYQLPQARTLLRLDGQYGTGAVLADLGGFAFVTRGKDYRVLDHPLVQARLHLPPHQFQQRTAKSHGAQPLRLPRSARRARRPALPRGRRNASSH